jgi:hypothetical protein
MTKNQKRTHNKLNKKDKESFECDLIFLMIEGGLGV